MQNIIYFIGIDGGGTRCRARIRDASDRLIGEGASGSANLYTNPAQAADSILAAIKAAFSQKFSSDSEIAAAMAESCVCMSLAGGNLVEAPLDRLQERGPFPFATCTVEQDLLAACRGAFHGQDGWLGIVGTGSAFANCRAGVIRIQGGWGLKAGDEASAAYLGREALRETLKVIDGLQPSSELTTAIIDKYGKAPRDIAAYIAKATPAEFGKLAPLLVECYSQGDERALEIVRPCLSYLESLLLQAYCEGIDRFCLYGGLSEFWSSLVRPEFQERMVAPFADAAEGALLKAKGLQPRA